MSPPPSVEIYLDPELAHQRKAERDRRHNVRLIPALRLLGFLFIAAILVVHNDLVLGAVDWRRYTWFAAASGAYVWLSWLLLLRLYRPFARIDLGLVFLLVDNLFWAFAVYVSGGEQSWLFVILLAHVVDQGATTVRRVLVFANAAVAAYLATLAWIAVVDRQAVQWDIGVAKAALLYVFGLYGAVTAAPAESLRRRSVSAIRMARTSISDLAAQRQQLEERTVQLAEAMQRAEQASQAKTEFLARVSHEMRTPMNAILGFAQVLESDELTPQQRGNVDQILTAGERLLGLINDVLELDGIEQNRVALELVAVPVRELLAEVKQLATKLAAAHDVAFDIDAIDDCAVHADRRRLKQVLLNLISNALKYNRPGGSVRVRCEVAGERVRIIVADTGIGIAPERVSSVFTPFERLGPEGVRAKGVGLGLVVSRALVRAMNGELGLRSEPAVGSTFWVELPIAAPPAGESAPAEASRDQPRRRPRILCVEDNPANARLVEILLSRQRAMEVTFADTGTRALELAQHDPPDLMLLDLNLPDISGLDVLRAMRSYERTRPTRIVVVSADAIPQHVEALLAAGADDYITKPYNISDFIAAVQRLLPR